MDYDFFGQYITGQTGRQKPPKHARPTGWGDGEVSWYDEDGFIRHDPPRTKYSHPYNYDPIERISGTTRGVPDVHAVYHDRMQQWDYDKFRAAMEAASGKKTGERHFSWGDRTKVKKFMQHYFDDKTLKVVRVVEVCNASSGYPYWVIWYTTGKDKKEESK